MCSTPCSARTDYTTAGGSNRRPAALEGTSIRIPTDRRNARPALARPYVVLLALAGVILAGWLLLMLPLSAQEGRTPPVHALFVAASAATVTGLSPLDLGVHFSGFGQGVILLLIEVGGIGFASASVLLFAFSGREVGLGDRLFLQESLGASQLGGVVGLSYSIIRITLLIEAAGFALLALRFVPDFGVGRGLWIALFQAVSTFCNTGLDLAGTPEQPFGGLARYRADVYVNLVLAVLIILGGLSFPVLAELAAFRRGARLSMYARLILWSNAALWLLGMAAYAVTEWSNPSTLGPLPTTSKLAGAFFASAALRTGGVALIPLAAVATGTQLISMALMFVGASSESTGGGIKVSTFGVLLAVVWDTLRGREKVHVLGRRLIPETIYKALTVAVVSAVFVGAMSIALLAAEGGAYKPLLWETISAFSTVGLTLDQTPKLSSAGMLLIVFTMYWGRLGPITLVTAILHREEPEPLTYPTERIPIG